MTEVITEEADGKTNTVVVSRQVSHPIKKVWDVLMTGEGAEALLGPGATLGDKGHTWESTNGTHGAVRSFHPLEEIRFSWHASEDAPATWIDLRLRPAGDDATVLELAHTRLYDDLDRAEVERRLAAALARIDNDAL